MRRELASVTRSAGSEPAAHEASKHEHGRRAVWRPADPYPLHPGARRALRALIRALCPPAPAPRGDALFDRVETVARTCFRYMHPVVAFGIQLTLLVLEWLPLLTLRSWHRLHALAPDQVRALFGKLVESRLGAVRLSMVGLRAVVLGAYFDQDEVHRAIGYAPFPFMEERVLLRRSLLRGIAQSAQLATPTSKPVAAE